MSLCQWKGETVSHVRKFSLAEAKLQVRTIFY